MITNFDRQFPQECDWASFGCDETIFEYQLGWLCYTNLETLPASMLSSLS